ncbi:MAG: thioredoxin domain-containing protein [Vampirovibrionia bacterium]
MNNTHSIPNKLINEKSPYLLQHAYNPVNWYPWSDEAFQLSKTENKPIFLSIGYSTCHWCHVMEHESFEDPEVAKLMNDTFVSIKVDKEERPDIDNIYMNVAQITTGSGGWPLSVIITPDKKPFYIATYIPKYDHVYRTGMLTLIPHIDNLWKTKRAYIENVSKDIINGLSSLQDKEINDLPQKSILEKTFVDLNNSFDKQNGGFGKSPKFPTPHNLIYLLRYWQSSKQPEALSIVERTLKSIRIGGIYDQIGKGVHRYSTDIKWLVPHFEKMLYDQALLSLAYTETFEATKNDFYKTVSKELLDFIISDLRSADGSFYSGIDADSEGEEGKYYLWSKKEFENVLNSEQSSKLINLLNIKSEGNYLDERSHMRNGFNIPYLSSINDWKHLNDIEDAFLTLLETRKQRVHPHIDDKILLDWNSLAIASLAKASKVFNEPVYLEAALKALEFINVHLLNSDYTLKHSYRDGVSSKYAFLDDYAFFTFALIELYEATFDLKYLQLALNITDVMIAKYYDNETAGFYFSIDSDELPLKRSKELYDGAIPSGNSMAVICLLKLSSLLNKPDYEKMAIDTIKLFSKRLNKIPLAYTMFLVAFNYLIQPKLNIFIAVNSSDKSVNNLVQSINNLYLPNKSIMLADLSLKEDPLFSFLDNYKRYKRSLITYICYDNSCKAPISRPDEVVDVLKNYV